MSRKKLEDGGGGSTRRNTKVTKTQAAKALRKYSKKFSSGDDAVTISKRIGKEREAITANRIYKNNPTTPKKKPK